MLRNDHANNDPLVINSRKLFRGFPEKSGPLKRVQFIEPRVDIRDYILIEDFFSDLEKRDRYLSSDSAVEECKLLKLNEACLDAAENALKNIDWDKYS